MERLQPRHLVIVRHGESEGDVRRSLKNQPTSNKLDKHPRDEEQTELGHHQCLLAGKWIAKHVLSEYGFDRFDWHKVSPLIRTVQSARSLGLDRSWQDDLRLMERDRGLIQGMNSQQHAEEYPESYRQMHDHPFHWTPPEGESLLRVAMRFGDLVDEFQSSSATTAIFVTHRDLMWASQVPLSITAIEHIEQVDTDKIHNGHIYHLTNVDPVRKELDTNGLIWMRSLTPWMGPDSDSGWINLSKNIVSSGA